MTAATTLPPNHLSDSRPASASLLFLLLYRIKKFVRDNGRVMSFHEDLFAGIMRFHLNTINYVGLPKTTSPTYFSLFKSLEIVSRLHVALPVGEETPMRANASEIFPGLLPFMN